MGEKEEKRITRKQLIALLQELDENPNYQKKRATYSKRESEFLIYAIFQAPLETSVFLFIMDEMITKTGTNLSGREIRRLKFLNHLLETNFNGAKSARRAGYSPHCAKQIAWQLRNRVSRKRHLF